jgi:hypothetical protein
VSGQEQVGRTTCDVTLGLIGVLGDNRVANNRAEAVNLGSQLDLDGLAGLDLDSSLLLVRLEGRVGGYEGGGRDGGRVGKTCSMGG